MRILIAPTAYKGTFSPVEVAKAMSDAVSEFQTLAASSARIIEDIYVDTLALADGGDGTIEALALSTGGTIHSLEVTGSLGEPRTALWLDRGDCAVVELASACGIAGIEFADLRPLTANSLGLGSVLKHVLETTDIPQIVVAVGGSASTDGGSAALYELGARFFDHQGKQFLPAGGGSLHQIARCDLSVALLKLRGRQIQVATDVSNPLLGPAGAAYIYGPQKGANKAQVAMLDNALTHFADIIEFSISSRIRDFRGAGAAGGTAFGLSALGASISPGFDYIAQLTGLEARVRNSDLVLTGEGRTDLSSLNGKVVGALNALCMKYKKPLMVFSGSVAEDFAGSNLHPEILCPVAAPGAWADKIAITQAVLASMCSKFEV